VSPLERKHFVRSHRMAIFGYGRREHGPSMTIVYYVMDGDDILVSTMAGRGKARVIARNPRVSLCVLDEQWPPTYLLVYCEARVETEPRAVVDLMMRIAGLMAGQPMPEGARPIVEEGARRENRVVLRLRPYATFETPPRHVYSPSALNEQLLHGYGKMIPWDAA